MSAIIPYVSLYIDLAFGAIRDLNDPYYHSKQNHLTVALPDGMFPFADLTIMEAALFDITYRERRFEAHRRQWKERVSERFGDDYGEEGSLDERVFPIDASGLMKHITLPCITLDQVRGMLKKQEEIEKGLKRAACRQKGIEQSVAENEVPCQ